MLNLDPGKIIPSQKNIAQSAPTISAPTISVENIQPPKEDPKQPVKSNSTDLFERAEEAGKEIKTFVRTKQEIEATFGLTETYAYIYNKTNKILKVTDLNSPSTFHGFQIKSNSDEFVIINNSIILFSASDGFNQCIISEGNFTKIPHELNNAKQMKIDPLFNERFFFLKQNKDLYVVQHTGELIYEEKKYKQNVSWFDLSRKFILFLIDGYYELWRRNDTEETYIWREKQTDDKKYYVDDNFLFEYTNNTVTAFNANNPSEPSIEPRFNVWHFWKGNSSVIETKDGIELNNTTIKLDYNIIAADANQKFNVVFDEHYNPNITQRKYNVNTDDNVYADEAFISASKDVHKEASKHVQTVIEAIHNGELKLIENLKEQSVPVQKHMATLAKNAKKVLKETEILKDSLIHSGSSVKSLAMMMKESDNPDEIAIKAISCNNEEFHNFVLENEFKENIPRFKQSTLIELIPKMASVLESDPQGISEILMSVLLQIDIDQNAGNDKLKANADDLMSTIICMYQQLPPNAPCMRTIRMLSHIAVSLKNI